MAMLPKKMPESPAFQKFGLAPLLLHDTCMARTCFCAENPGEDFCLHEEKMERKNCTQCSICRQLGQGQRTLRVAGVAPPSSFSGNYTHCGCMAPLGALDGSVSIAA